MQILHSTFQKLPRLDYHAVLERIVHIDKRIAAVAFLALGAILLACSYFKKPKVLEQTKVVIRKTLTSRFSKKIGGSEGSFSPGEFSLPTEINAVILRKVSWRFDLQGLDVPLNEGIYGELCRALGKDKAARILNVCQLSTWDAARQHALKTYGLDPEVIGIEKTCISIDDKEEVSVITELDFSAIQPKPHCTRIWRKIELTLGNDDLKSLEMNSLQLKFYDGETCLSQS